MNESNPIYTNIIGAPFKVGEIVKVIEHSNDNTFDLLFIKQIGKVIYFEYDCGCGQTFPNDPMIGVEFSNGLIEEFWKEELNSTL